MKAVRALVAAFAIAFAAPASAQPGIDDPELMAWMQSANAAQKARLEVLASRGDAPSLLMAMSLVHPMFPLRDDPEREIAAERALAWALLERAAKADPQDPVVAWKLATCTPDSGLADCGSPASRERLAALGKSRAEVNLYLAQVSQAIGDEAAFEAFLQLAAEAPGFDAYAQEQSRLIGRAWEGVGFPDADPAVVRSYAGHIEVDAGAFVEQMVAMSVFARITGSLLPDFEFPLGVCGVGGGEDISALRRRQCLAIFTTMGEDKPSILQRIVAGQAMVHLTADSPGASAWKARLRTTAWVQEAGVPLLATLSARHDPAYYAGWLEEGEYQSLLGLMQRRGVEPSPPQEWLPENEGMRSLLGEDIADPHGAASAHDVSAGDPQPE